MSEFRRIISDEALTNKDRWRNYVNDGCLVIRPMAECLKLAWEMLS